MNELDVYVEQLKEEFDSKSKRRTRGKEYQHIRYLISKARKIEDPKLRRKTVRGLAVRLRESTSKVADEYSKRLMYIRYADD